MGTVPRSNRFVGCRRRPDLESLNLILLVFALAVGGFSRLKRAHEANSFGGANYYSLGLNLRTQGVLAFPTNPRLPSAYRGPLYPSFIAVLLPKGEVPFPRLVLYVQAVLGILAIAVLYVLGAAVHSRLAGGLAALAYAVNAHQIDYGASLEIEHFYSLLLLSVACALVYWLRRPSIKSSLALGLAVGFSLSCRSVLFLLPAFLAAACLARPRFFHQDARKHLALIFICSMLTLAPWVVRNAVRFRAFVPFERFAAACNFFTASKGMVGTLLPSQAYEIASAGDRSFARLDEDAKNAELGRLAAAGIFASPGKYIWSSAKRAAFIVRMHPCLWSLSLLALWLDRRRRRLLPLAYLAAYFWGIHSLLSVEGRYIVPLMPVLIVLASSGLASAVMGVCRCLRGDEEVPPPPSSSLDRLRSVLGLSLLISGATFAVAAFKLASECRLNDLRTTAEISSSSEGIIPMPGPASARAHFFNDRGVRRFFAGDIPGAADDFQQASRIDPRLSEPYLSLGAVRSRQGRHKEALQACATAVGLAESEDSRPSPDSKEGQALLALALECCANESKELGRPDQARFYSMAGRRSISMFADRLRSSAQSPRAER